MGLFSLPFLIRIREEHPNLNGAVQKCFNAIQVASFPMDTTKGTTSLVDLMETAMIEVLGSLCNSPDFHDLISLPNEYGQTLAHWSVLSGLTSLLSHLIGWGMNLRDVDINGFTALHCAYLRKDYRSIQILERNGASQLVKDKIDRVPADLAPADFFMATPLLAPESELDPEEECPELASTLYSDSDEEAGEVDALDEDGDGLKGDQTSVVTIHSEDNSFDLGNTNPRYHARAESEIKVVISQLPSDTKSDKVHKKAVETLDQTTGNRCICTW